MATARVDLCVIGAGPGGFAAATRAAQRGAQVVLIEQGPLGGVCLNTGCIPSRAIGTTASLAAALRRSERLGIKVAGHEVVWPDVLARKDRIVRRHQEGLKQLVQARKIQLVAGRAVVRGPGQVEVVATDGSSTAIEAKQIIVATGSRPKPLPSMPFDGRQVLSSDDLLRLPALPARLVVIGGGVIGCEFASYLAPLGVEVTILELAPSLLPGQDADIVQALTVALGRAGVQVKTGVTVAAIETNAHGVTVKASGQLYQADQVLVTIGRQPNTRDLGLEQIGVRISSSGHVQVDDHLRVADGVYAIGDIIGRYQTAYTASHEGMIAAENALGASHVVDYAVVPDCIFTIPEIATVGLTEAAARAAGQETAVSRVPWTACGRAQTLEETDGFLKLVYERASHTLLGVQIVGPRATDLIAEAAVALRQRMTLDQLMAVLHAHPTLAEMFWEASAQPLGLSLYVR